MITKFNQYIKESLADKMSAKSLDVFFTYNNFKNILRNFKDDPIEHEELKILFEKILTSLDSNPEDLRYFVIKEDSFTADINDNMIYVKDYIHALEEYTKGGTSEIVKVPGLSTDLVQSVVVFKDKKVIIVHAVHGSMIVLDKNIFY